MDTFTKIALLVWVAVFLMMFGLCQYLDTKGQLNTSINSGNHIVVHFHSSRLDVLDSSNQVIYSCSVVGGRGYENHQFSNEPGSHMSSLGHYRVGPRHEHNGLSWNMIGLDSTNSNAYDRAILLHAADYVPGGHSWGCFAVSYASRDKLATLIDTGTDLVAVDD